MVLLRAACRSLLGHHPATAAAAASLRTTSRSRPVSSRPMSTAAYSYATTNNTGDGAAAMVMPKYAIEMPIPTITILDNGVTIVTSYCAEGEG